jgi:hypothetical protein
LAIWDNLVKRHLQRFPPLRFYRNPGKWSVGKPAYTTQREALQRFAKLRSTLTAIKSSFVNWT